VSRSFPQAGVYDYRPNARTARDSIPQFDRGGFNKTQADLLWNAGLSYRYHL
jgi:hypothetical protein